MQLRERKNNCCIVMWWAGLCVAKLTPVISKADRDAGNVLFLITRKHKTSEPKWFGWHGPQKVNQIATTNPNAEHISWSMQLRKQYETSKLARMKLVLASGLGWHCRGTNKTHKHVFCNEKPSQSPVEALTSNTSLQNSFPLLLSNTLLQHFSTTGLLLYNTLLRQSSPTLFSKTFLLLQQHCGLRNLHYNA